MKRQRRTIPSTIRISDWDESTVVCDLCGTSWSFENAEKARTWMSEHKWFHAS